ncbi:hypothetical protein R1flu_020049 [Riccia fluitans]|uniref:Uncharacterized protein n=1 Tax=Riccia fluitans TaxID=41844 RepID=A0ABD1ZMK6_9MARC
MWRNEEREPSHQPGAQVERVTRAAPLERKTTIKIYEDNLGDDDFLSDDNAINEEATLTSTTLSYFHRHVIGFERGETISVVDVDDIGDYDTLVIGLPGLILNEPNNIPDDVGLCSLYKLYGRGPLEGERKKAKKNEKQKVEEEPKNVPKNGHRSKKSPFTSKDEIEVDNDVLVTESPIRRTHQLNPENYKVQLGIEPAEKQFLDE